ncbi:MAG: SpoIIIAC/SpoIIIAD family protein, partial [Clostridiales bacterium]
QSTGLKMDYVPLILKVVAVSYIGEFAQELCKDAGESGIAKKVELGVKIIIMLLALPLLKAILQTVLELLK